MRLLYVPLDRSELEVLEALAVAERRRPQDQAAVLLSRALAQAADPLERSRAVPLSVLGAADPEADGEAGDGLA